MGTQVLHIHCTSSEIPSPLSPHLTHAPVSIAPNQPTPQRHNPCQPGRLLRLFLEPKSLTLENTFNLFLSQLPLLLLGLLTHLQALDFSRSLACLFWRIRELAMAAAMAATAPALGPAQARGGRRPAAASMLLGRPQGRGAAGQPGQGRARRSARQPRTRRRDEHRSPGAARNSLARAILSSGIFPFSLSGAFLFLPTSSRGKFAGRGERFYGDHADHLQDIPPSFSRRAICTQPWHIHLVQDHRISPSPDFSS